MKLIDELQLQDARFQIGEPEDEVFLSGVEHYSFWNQSASRLDRVYVSVSECSKVQWRKHLQATLIMKQLY